METDGIKLNVTQTSLQPPGVTKSECLTSGMPQNLPRLIYWRKPLSPRVILFLSREQTIIIITFSVSIIHRITNNILHIAAVKISSELPCCCSNQQSSWLHYSTMQALASRNDIGSNTVSCIPMGRLACDPSENGSQSLALARRKNIEAGLKCSPNPPSSWVNVKWHSQMDSIVDVLSVHREHKEVAQMVKQSLCSYFWDERERGERKGLHASLYPLLHG